MLKKMFLFLLSLTGAVLFAQVNYAPDITAWGKTSFQTPLPNGGINGGPALEYVRTNPKEYRFVQIPCPKITPGKRYRGGVYVKTEGMPKLKEGATFAMEITRKDGKGCGVWPAGTCTAKDWVKVEDCFTVPSDAVSVRMLLYMRAGATGKAWFARPYIYEDVPMLHCDIILPAGKYAIPAGKTDLVFCVNAEGISLDGISFGAEVRKEGKSFLSRKLKSGADRLVLKDLSLTPGKYTVTLTPAIPKMASTVLDFTVLPKGAKPAKGSHSYVDEHGRLILNGKPFMPIGLYASGLSTRKDFQIWKKAGFNSAMPYNTVRWKREGATGRVAQIAKGLDECYEEGIWLLFSLKDIKPGRWDKLAELKGDKVIVEQLVKGLKDHPAILGWYLDDEEADDVHYKGLRKRVSTLDPYHVTIQVQNSLSRLPKTVGYSDIFAPDPYPFYKESDGMDMVTDHMLMSRQYYGKALMAVPQTFAWYRYRKGSKDRFYPTMKQMRSHILMEAILGARGFYFYTYLAPENHKKLTGEDKWPEFVQLAGMLNELSPYILSVENPEVKLSEVKGRVFAKAMKANGKVKVLVAGSNGKTSARLTVPGQEKLRSRWGRTKNLGKGVYLFTGDGADADILE